MNTFIIPAGTKVKLVKSTSDVVCGLYLEPNTQYYTLDGIVNIDHGVEIFTLDPCVATLKQSSDCCLFGYPILSSVSRKTKKCEIMIPYKFASLKLDDPVMILPGAVGYSMNTLTVLYYSDEKFFNLKSNKVAYSSAEYDKFEEYEVNLHKFGYESEIRLFLKEDIFCTFDKDALPGFTYCDKIGDHAKQIYKKCEKEHTDIDHKEWDKIIHEDEVEYSKLESLYGDVAYYEIKAFFNRHSNANQ